MLQAASRRIFQPGTTGWSVDDLQDQNLLREWSSGRHEIADGVLTEMAPQGYHGVYPLTRLREMILEHARAQQTELWCHAEVDLRLRRNRIARPDLLVLTADQTRQQDAEERKLGIDSSQYCPVLVTPSLIVESVSHGEEEHDRQTKRAWYAEAKIPLYWLLTSFERSLVCLRLDRGGYVIEAEGHDQDQLTVNLLSAPFHIELARLW
jgi:Uma2 family endonuclease